MNRMAALSPLSGVRHWARVEPSRLAVVDGELRVTYGELARRVDAAASLLASEGVGRTSVVGMSLRNCLDALVIPLAAGALGARISPVTFRLKGREFRAHLALMSPRFFVYGEDIAPAVQECAFSAGTRFVSTAEFEARLREHLGRGGDGGFDNANETYTLMWTSGTGGHPKLCCGSLVARMNWILTLPYVYGLRADDRYLAALPIMHSAGMTFALAHLFFGACVYTVSRFEATDVWRLIVEAGITSGLFVPTMLQIVLDEDPRPDRPVPSTLRMLITAGSRIRPDLHRRILKRFPGRLYTYYGSTESPSMTVLSPQEQEAHADSVGRAYLGVEIVVRNFREMPDHKMPAGDILVRSPFAMDEYWTEGKVIPIGRDGWIETGDIGYFDDEGFLHVFGRASDIIVSGGLNVSLPEIEHVIAAHPSVKDVAVIGIEDERWGDVPAAAIVPADSIDAQSAIDAVRQQCREQLAGYKRPRRIIALSEIPRTASGKPAAAEIRALLSEGDGQNTAGVRRWSTKP